MSLRYSELRIGTVFLYEGAPYEVLEYSFVRMQQRKAVAQITMRNLLNGKVISHNFHKSDTLESAEIIKKPVKFLYHNREQYWFCEKENPSQRFFLIDDVVGAGGQFLKSNTDVTALLFQDTIINIQLPIKVDLMVKDAPPGERGNTAQGGVKVVELETGAKLNVPLFVNTGDVVRVNTETGEYVERVEKV